MNRVLTLLRPRRTAAVRSAPPAARPAGPRGSVGVFAIRVGHSGATPFQSSLGQLDAMLREVLDAQGRDAIRPVATVVLPEAVHLVVCGRSERIERFSDRLLARFERSESGSGTGGANRPLRLSVLRVGGLAAAAGTILDLPRARGLVSSGESWPWASAGEG